MRTVSKLKLRKGSDLLFEGILYGDSATPITSLLNIEMAINSTGEIRAHITETHEVDDLAMDPETFRLAVTSERSQALAKAENAPKYLHLEWHRPNTKSPDCEYKHWAVVEGGWYIINPISPRSWLLTFQEVNEHGRLIKLGLHQSLDIAKVRAQRYEFDRLKDKIPSKMADDPQLSKSWEATGSTRPATAEEARGDEFEDQ